MLMALWLGLENLTQSYRSNRLLHDVVVLVCSLVRPVVHRQTFVDPVNEANDKKLGRGMMPLSKMESETLGGKFPRSWIPDRELPDAGLFWIHGNIGSTILGGC